jgi:hypothetical protein
MAAKASSDNGVAAEGALHMSEETARLAGHKSIDRKCSDNPLRRVATFG